MHQLLQAEIKRYKFNELFNFFHPITVVRKLREQDEVGRWSKNDIQVKIFVQVEVGRKSKKGTIVST